MALRLNASLQLGPRSSGGLFLRTSRERLTWRNLERSLDLRFPVQGNGKVDRALGRTAGPADL